MSRRSLRMIFPDLVLGRSSAQMIRLGLASLPIWRPTWSRSTVSRSASGTAPDPRVTYATTAWPVRSSAEAMTAASATAGCETRADSISAVDSRWPETLITSSTRPVIQK
jgi:hypothetical protein